MDMKAFYEQHARALADQQSKEAREQIKAAFDAPPTSEEDVDPWFIRNFHKPPVAQETALYNQLYALKAPLAALFKPAAETA